MAIGRMVLFLGLALLLASCASPFDGDWISVNEENLRIRHVNLKERYIVVLHHRGKEPQRITQTTMTFHKGETLQLAEKGRMVERLSGGDMVEWVVNDDGTLERRGGEPVKYARPPKEFAINQEYLESLIPTRWINPDSLEPVMTISLTDHTLRATDPGLVELIGSDPVPLWRVTHSQSQGFSLIWLWPMEKGSLWISDNEVSFSEKTAPGAQTKASFVTSAVPEWSR